MSFHWPTHTSYEIRRIVSNVEQHLSRVSRDAEDAKWKCRAPELGKYFNVEYKCTNTSRGMYCRRCTRKGSVKLLIASSGDFNYFHLHYGCHLKFDQWEDYDGTHVPRNRKKEMMCPNLKTKNLGLITTDACWEHYCACEKYRDDSTRSFVMFIMGIRSGCLGSFIATYLRTDLLKIINKHYRLKQVWGGHKHNKSVHYVYNEEKARKFIKENTPCPVGWENRVQE